MIGYATGMSTYLEPWCKYEQNGERLAGQFELSAR